MDSPPSDGTRDEDWEILSTGSTQVTDLGDGVGRWSPGGAFLQQLIDIKRRLVEQHPDNELLRDYDPTRAMPGRELFALFSLVHLQKDGLAEATPPRDTSGSLVWFPTRALAREMRLPHREPDKALPHHDPESQKATGMKEWPTLIAPRSRSACSRRNMIAMSPPSDSKAPCE